MASDEEILGYLKKEVNERRFLHILSTTQTAEDMAEKLGADRDGCRIAGLLHDCAKNITGQDAIDMCEKYGIVLDYILAKQTNLLHGYLGEVIAREKFGIDNEDILNAIANHTMGRPGMSLVEKIIFLADYIEPRRFFPGVEELRETAYRDIDTAVIMAIDGTIRKILSKNELLHPRILDTRNYYISIRGGSDGS